MGEIKVTKMVIKVDLACHKCRKKIKKILCSIPQIQDQIFDEKNNTVLVTVVCCNPEKIKDKIYCKGGPTIKGIEILKPPLPDQVVVVEQPKPPRPPPVKPPGPVIVVEQPRPPSVQPRVPEPAPMEPAEPWRWQPPIFFPPPGPPCCCRGWCQCYELRYYWRPTPCYSWGSVCCEENPNAACSIM